MAKKQSAFKTKGMNRDLSVSAFNPEFSFENKNLRLSTNDDNTTMSWVNERGTLPLDLYKEVTYSRYWTKDSSTVYEDPEDDTWTLHDESITVLEPTTILGTPVGTSLIENKLVLFTHISSSENVENHDYIYVITYLNEQKTELKVREFLSGNYNFSVSHPLETISSYESENVQKVYWTDYLNNFRYINIEGVPEDEKRKMDAVLLFNEEVTVHRSFENTGPFPPGVIQYAFTYVEKYGAETPVVYTTPLYYIVNQNGLGADADSRINTRFTITISNVNGAFGKIRLYSIVRTSLDATPEVKMVVERNISPSDTSVIIEDTNTGTAVDSLLLAFTGAPDLRIGTIAQKDGVLFYGNIAASWEKDVFYTYLEPSVTSLFTDAEVTSVLSQRDFAYTEEETSPFPIRINTATTSTGECTSAAAFKAREYYRLGIQFQNRSGIWSEPLFLGDYQWNTQDFHGPLYEKENDEWTFKVPEFTLKLDAETQQSLFDVGYRRARAVYVQPDASGRTILHQGIACPTMRYQWNGNNNYPSWLFRFKWTNSQGFSVYPQAGDPELADYAEYNGTANFWVCLNNSLTYKTVNGSLIRDYYYGSSNKGLYRDKSTFTLEFWNCYTYNETYVQSSPGTAIRELFGRVQYGNFDVTGYAQNKLYNMHEEGDSTRLSLCSSSEIQFPSEFYIDNTVISFHSPDVEYGELSNDISEYSYSSHDIYSVGTTNMKCTTGNVIVDLSGSNAISQVEGYKGGLTYNVPMDPSAYTIMPPECVFMSPQIYEDSIVGSDSEGKPKPFIHKTEHEMSLLYNTYFYNNHLYSWPVYMWHRDGSLNNDINRSDGAVRTGVYVKKIFAHYRISEKSVWKEPEQILYNGGGKLFNHVNADTSLRLGDTDRLYSGKLDTTLDSNSLKWWHKRFFLGRKRGHAYYHDDDTTHYKTPNVAAKFNVIPQFYLREKLTNSSDIFDGGLFSYTYLGSEGKEVDSSKSKAYYETGCTLAWHQHDLIGYYNNDLLELNDNLRMQYTSSSHYVIWGLNNSIYDYTDDNTGDVQLPILEITSEYNPNTFFGGQSPDVLRTHTWIPCGPPVTINDEAVDSVNVEYKWGDTYFQWYECIKTNPITNEDKNQVIEVGGFFLENRVNLIGRNDNRLMSPSTVLTKIEDVKFNPVYSQFNNYFNYKIISENPEDEVRSDTIKAYSNNIFYSLVKTSGQTPDPWTEINRNSPSSFEVDGRYGAVTKLINFDNQVYVFQERAISQILYNENVQIASTEGVPIEIASSEKVRGVRYISTTIGCNNKYSIVSTPRGIYFIGTDDKSLYLFNGQLTNLSTSAGFNSWFKQKVPVNNVSWNPVDFGNFVSYYDALNQDVLFLNNETALAFSEKVGNFTSFYDYGDVPFFCNFDGTGLWVDKNGLFWKHNEGDYCRFFGVNKPYSMTLIGNPEPQTDKIFTNLEFRACIEGEPNDAIPFDYLETWDEYQHGIANLDIKEGVEAAQHYLADNSASLNRKFRMWRCDIPRDNAKIDADRTPGNALEKYSTDAELGVTRNSAHSMDRMRNPWLYLKLQKNAAPPDVINEVGGEPTIERHSLPKLEIHDLVMTYYN